jgi:CheY-like chemotaxis protein
VVLTDNEKGGTVATATATFQEQTAAPSPSAVEGSATPGFQSLQTLIRPVDEEKSNDALRGGNRPLRLVMAEDMPSARKLARFLLKKLGHDVTLVPDGAGLMKALQTIRFDGALIDIQMPGEDGLEVARRIRSGEAGEANRDLFLAAVTASVTDDIRRRCTAVGMDWFVDKPLLSHKLQILVDQIYAAGKQA